LAALVVEIDTPGGLDTATRDIIQAEIDSPIPIVFYVFPQGARAASAGVYILMGSDVAVMAPQTNLGAATPVSLTGEMDEVMRAKVTNDAAAYIKGLATTHGRNAVWAEQAVRQSVSLPAEDAQRQNVIDFVAADLPALLRAIDGYVTTPKALALRTAGAPINEVKMGWIQRFLHAIANPDIAYILMTIGILGIILEFATPGLGVSGIAGAICLLLAFYAFQVLPVSLVGIALVVLAMILYAAEIKIQSHGILGIGGTASLVAGGLLLFDTSASFLKVSWPVLIVAAVIVLAFFMLVVRKVALAMRRPHATGAESLVGTSGVTISPLSPQGQVRLRGEIWRARAEEGDLLKDERIEVLRTEGLTLIVRRKT
jgi:membrane-bound serine protease (ClpP class)